MWWNRSSGKPWRCCCYGSNFPIEKLWTDYGTLYRTFRGAIAHLSDGEQAAILHDTASRLYRI
jgi:predicted TIM-barrel fold metal-dependent hydrolase